MPYPVKMEVKPNLTDFGVYVDQGIWYRNLKKLILKSPCPKHVNYWKRYFDSSHNFIGNPEKP